MEHLRHKICLYISLLLCCQLCAEGLPLVSKHYSIAIGSSGEVDAFSQPCASITLLSPHSKYLQVTFNSNCSGSLSYRHLGHVMPREIVTEFVVESPSKQLSLISVRFTVKDNLDYNALIIENRKVAVLRANETLSRVLRLEKCEIKIRREPKNVKLLGLCTLDYHSWQKCEDVIDLYYERPIEFDEVVFAVRHKSKPTVNIVVHLVDKVPLAEPSFASKLAVNVAAHALTALRYEVLFTEDPTSFFSVVRKPEDCEFVRPNTRAVISWFTQTDIDNIEIALLCTSNNISMDTIDIELFNILGKSSEPFSLTVIVDPLVNVETNSVVLFKKTKASFEVVANMKGSNELEVIEAPSRGVIQVMGLPVISFLPNTQVDYTFSSRNLVISTDNMVVQCLSVQIVQPLLIIPTDMSYHRHTSLSVMRAQEDLIIISVPAGRRIEITESHIKEKFLGYFMDLLRLGSVTFTVDQESFDEGQFEIDGEITSDFSLDDILDSRITFRASPEVESVAPHEETASIRCHTAVSSFDIPIVIQYIKIDADRSIPRKTKGIALKLKVPARQFLPISLRREQLSYEDSSEWGPTCAKNIYYKITTSLSDLSYLNSGLNCGYIGDANGNERSEFTQSEINQAKIYYYPPTSIVDRLQPRTLTFEFSVSDKSSNKVGSHKFHIYLDSIKIGKTINKTLIGKRSSVSIDSRMIDASYNDSVARFMISSVPRHGRLTDTKSGQDDAQSVLVVGDIFTYQEVLDATIEYIANATPQPKPDYFELIVTTNSEARQNARKNKASFTKVLVNLDVGNASKSNTIHDQKAPYILPDQIVRVEEGDSAKLDLKVQTNGGVFWCDIIEPPNYGYISYKGTIFHFNNSVIGDLEYVQNLHVQLEPREDSFVVQCVDGVHESPSGKVFIEIIPTNDEKPYLQIEDIRVLEGKEVFIPIKATDRDSPRDPLLFRVSRQPNYGSIGILKEDGFLEENVKTFDEKDIPSIIYKHDDSETTEDKFEVMVDDGEHSVAVEVNVEIMPVDDQVPQVEVNKGARTMVGEKVTLTSGNLRLSDGDSPQGKIKVVVVKTPQWGSLLVDGQTLTAFTPEGNGRRTLCKSGKECLHRYFTQQDLIDGRVSYFHNLKVFENPDCFEFVASDGVNVGATRYTFNITIETPNVNYITHRNVELNVQILKQVLIPLDILSANSSDPQWIKITEQPRFAKLSYNESSNGIQYEPSEAALSTLRTEDDVTLTVFTEGNRAENLSIHLTWCWFTLEINGKDDDMKEGDHVEIIVRRVASRSSKGFSLADLELRTDTSSIPVRIDSNEMLKSIPFELPKSPHFTATLRQQIPEEVDDMTCSIYQPKSQISVDIEPALGVHFEHKSYTVQEADTPTICRITVVKTGNILREVTFLASTMDGTAVAGKDYLPLENKEYIIPKGRNRTSIEVQILSDHVYENTEVLQIIISSTDDQGSPKTEKASLFIEDVNPIPMFHAKPIVVSLNNAGEPSAPNVLINKGKPALCLTACDTRHPRYSESHCASLNNNMTLYEWRMRNSPKDRDMLIRAKTYLVRTNTAVLDPIYFVAGGELICSVKAASVTGDVGTAFKSEGYMISNNEGVCPSTEGQLGAQPYTSQLRLITNTSSSVRNNIELSLSIPHEDGLLVLFSTEPISYVDYERKLLYKGKHRCSNFLNTRNIFDGLSLTSCSWNYRFVYTLENLVNECGAHLDYDNGVDDHSSVTISLPLHVTYLRRSCQSGQWLEVSLSNILQIRFIYNSAVTGIGGLLPSQVEFAGTMEPHRTNVDADGNLSVLLKTVAYFNGYFVLSPNEESFEEVSQIISPAAGTRGLFKIRLNRFTSAKEQEWKFESSVPMNNYTGNYTINMYPCLYISGKNNSNTSSVGEQCSVVENQMFSFVVPLKLEAMKSGRGRSYSMTTLMSLTRDENKWIDDELRNNMSEVNDVFYRGDTVYGKIRVLLEEERVSLFQTNIDKCYLCQMEDFSSSAHPHQHPDNQNSSFNCVDENHDKLNCILKILDVEEPNTVDTHYKGSQFHSKLVSSNSKAFDGRIVDELRERQSSDGFQFDVDPLFTDKRLLWHIHCIFTVLDANSGNREKRSVTASMPSFSETMDGYRPLRLEQSNAKILELLRSSLPGVDFSLALLFIICTSVIASLLLLVLSLSLIKFVARKPLYEPVKPVSQSIVMSNISQETTEPLL